MSVLPDTAGGQPATEMSNPPLKISVDHVALPRTQETQQLPQGDVSHAS